MGTNYYARIKPNRSRKAQIKRAIDDNNFTEVRALIAQTYSAPQYDYETGTYVGGEVHLGKRSAGWKFLWNPNLYKLNKGHLVKQDNGDGSTSSKWVEDGYDVFKYYDLTKQSITKFVNRKDVEIYNEYDEKIDKAAFLDMAFSWGYCGDKTGWDGEAYEEWENERNPNRHVYIAKSQYTDFLEELGYELNKYYTDFYSDGLRFATNTDFC